MRLTEIAAQVPRFDMLFGNLQKPTVEFQIATVKIFPLVLAIERLNQHLPSSSDIALEPVEIFHSVRADFQAIQAI
jgi:hypothetical protein